MRRLTLLVLVAVAGVLGAIWVTAAGAAIPTVATKPTFGPPITACPMVVAILTVGRFSFRVR